MGIIKFYFHPVFVIFSFCMIYYGAWSRYLVYMLALLLHELAHFAVARMLGYKMSNILFMPYGVSLDARGEYISPSHEVLIALAGPVCNLLLVMISVCIWWIEPTFYVYTFDFAMINLTLAIFNFLPILPLDGGRVITSVFYKNQQGVKKTLNIICCIILIVSLIMFVVSMFYVINFSYLFVACFLISSLYSKGNDKYYKYAKKYNCVYDIPKKECTIIVPKDIETKKLLKYIDDDYYTYFKYVDEMGHTIKICSAKQIINNMTKNK